MHWISKGIRKSCAYKRILRKDSYKTRTANVKTKYQVYSKLLKKCILLAKKQSNNKYVLRSKNICKATWRVIRDEIDSKSQHSNDIDSIEYLSNTIKNPHKIATTFNEYFIESNNKSIFNNIREFSNDIINNSIYFTPVTNIT